MKGDKNIQSKIFGLQTKIEHAVNKSSGSVEDESRIDDLQYELLRLEEGVHKSSE